MFKKVVVYILCFSLFSFVSLVSAEEEEAAVEADSGYQYYEFEPDIITNYIKPGQRLGYIRLGIDLMVKSSAAYEEVSIHEPLIRDRIIVILGEQTESQIKSIDEREAFRLRCLTEANEEIFKITGNRPIEDLLFTKYLDQ